MTRSTELRFENVVMGKMNAYPLSYSSMLSSGLCDNNLLSNLSPSAENARQGQKLQILTNLIDWSITGESNLTWSTKYHLQSASSYNNPIFVPLPSSTECRLQLFPECSDIASKSCEACSGARGANHSSKTFCNPGEVADDDSSGCCCAAL